MNHTPPPPGSQVDPVSLSEVVTADVLRPLAVSTEAQDHLSPHLPPSQESPQEVLTSPQFQQALGVFGSALHSGQLGPRMAQFGMGEEVARAASTGGGSQGLCVSLHCLSVRSEVPLILILVLVLIPVEVTVIGV